MDIGKGMSPLVPLVRQPTSVLVALYRETGSQLVYTILRGRGFF